MEKVPEEILQKQLCEELFERDYTAIAEQIREFRRRNEKPVKRNSSCRNRRNAKHLC